MAEQTRSKNSGRKVGRGNSKVWVASGGPGRRARRAARNHGCNLVALHLGGKGKRDRKHSGMKG